MFEFLNDGRREPTGYDIGRRYRRFRATIGMRDDSPATSSASFVVLADGRPVYDQLVRWGSTAVVDLDISEVLRIEIQNGVPEGLRGQAYVVWGNAQLQ
ncbi:MAG: NPCBM/NEW2 domain-containing protein [Acidimicrobiales bacterium]